MKTGIRTGLICLLILGSGLSKGRAQNIDFSRKVVDTLCSPYFWGRGYTRSGMEKAAIYIANMFRQSGLVPLREEGYFQEFAYASNILPDRVAVSLNNKKLVPGRDYLVAAESRSLKGNYKLSPKDSLIYYNHKAGLVLEKVKKLIWTPSETVAEYTRIQLLDTTGRLPVRSVKVDIHSQLIPEFKVSNVCAMVKGTQHPDSFLVVTAHYDHLGGMGDATYFPGANDNASGVALMLNLAQYYARYPQAYSMVFIAFAGEEIGLKGSHFFTEHPLIPLKNVKFLINTDLAGTGSDGITVVNASLHTREFAWMQEINQTQKLFKVIKERGEAANSDHYFFSKKGVPALFIYTMGGISAYHDIYDRAATLPLDHQEALFQLIKSFFEKII